MGSVYLCYPILYMVRYSILLSVMLLFLSGCRSRSMGLAGIDPEIVLINIEDGDRAFIGKVLLKLDSLHPAVIGVDVTFKGRRKQDSVLIAAFKKIKNDILIYNVSQNGTLTASDSAFTNLVAGQGNLYFEQKLGLVTTTIPLQKINDTTHESFALKIIKYWKPDFTSQIKVNEKVDINYTRNLESYQVISGSLLLNLNSHDLDLANKVILVGYTGPGYEDKYFTPLRKYGEHKSNEPDTYGMVIIANQIRTILEYNNQ